MDRLVNNVRLVLLLLVGALLGGSVAACSTGTAVVGSDVERRVYMVEGQNVTEPPEIKGGYRQVNRLKSYPQAAKEDEAYGVIWLQCTVTASGVATRINLVNSGHPSLETEALNVLQRLEFIPATLKGAPTRARIQIPIIFQGPYAEKKEEKGATADSTRANEG